MRDNKRGTIEDRTVTEALRRALRARAGTAQAGPRRPDEAESLSARSLGAGYGFRFPVE